MRGNFEEYPRKEFRRGVSKNRRISEDRCDSERRNESTSWVWWAYTRIYSLGHASLTFVSGYLRSRYLVGDLFQPLKHHGVSMIEEKLVESRRKGYRYVSDRCSFTGHSNTIVWKYLRNASKSPWTIVLSHGPVWIVQHNSTVSAVLWAIRIIIWKFQRKSSVQFVSRTCVATFWELNDILCMYVSRDVFVALCDFERLVIIEKCIIISWNMFIYTSK